MGSRADQKLKEIDELRDGLSAKFAELERRFPIAGIGKKVALGLVGSSLSTPLLAFAFRRARGGGKKKKAKEQPVQPVVVSAFPKSLTVVAVFGIAAWAGTKVFETYIKTKNGSGESFRPAAVVTPIAEPGRHSGAGT